MCLFHPKNSPSDVSWLPEDEQRLLGHGSLGERPGHVGRRGDPGEQPPGGPWRMVGAPWKQLGEIPGDTFCYQILGCLVFSFQVFLGLKMIDVEE